MHGSYIVISVYYIRTYVYIHYFTLLGQIYMIKIAIYIVYNYAVTSISLYVCTYICIDTHMHIINISNMHACSYLINE